MDYAISDTAPLLDPQSAISDLGDDSLFNMLLENYDSSTIKTLEDLRVAMDKIDYYEIRMKSHAMKGPSAYIHSERVRRAAEIVQFCIDRQEAENAYKYYPQLIKEFIKLRRKIKEYLAKLKSILRI